ncbi:MAG: class I SAM-dependent methyltransferase [Acidobacteriaceae bacterium]
MEDLHTYILGNALTAEYERLDLMSILLDPGTRAVLLRLGVSKGWRCLELGGGNGSVTEWLCEQAGSSGSVTSIDINPKLIRLVPAQNLTVLEVDVRTSDLPNEPFDLVMCRAMLHQIAEYAPMTLAKMAAAVKPGGWLYVCEPDFHLVQTCDPEVWAKVWNGILAWGLSEGVDWNIGRRLPSLVSSLGLGHPEAGTEAPNIRGTSRGAVYFQLFLDIVRERVIGSGLVTAEAFAAAYALLDDPDYWTQCWMLTGVWVRKPLV